MLTSMKLDKSNQNMEVSESSDKREYPYGLVIHLDGDQLDKLGIKDVPEIGAEMMVTAKVSVDSVSTHESEDMENRNVSLQITEMAIGTGEKKRAADKMYGGSDES